MTAVHRRAAGADTSLPGVRPAIVVNDPALSASQPPAELAASAANALAHAAEGPATLRASPVPALAGREAARLIGVAYAGAGGGDDSDSRALAAFRAFHAGDPPRSTAAAEDREPDRDTLALAALLSGYTIDSAGYGLHHVLSQTLARFAGVGHGPSNAVMLPHTLVALERRGARAPPPSSPSPPNSRGGRRRAGCATSASTRRPSTPAPTPPPSAPSSTTSRRAPIAPSCARCTPRRTELERGSGAGFACARATAGRPRPRSSPRRAYAGSCRRRGPGRARRARRP